MCVLAVGIKTYLTYRHALFFYVCVYFKVIWVKEQAMCVYLHVPLRSWATRWIKGSSAEFCVHVDFGGHFPLEPLFVKLLDFISKVILEWLQGLTYKHPCCKCSDSVTITTVPLGPNLHSSLYLWDQREVGKNNSQFAIKVNWIGWPFSCTLIPLIDLACGVSSDMSPFLTADSSHSHPRRRTTVYLPCLTTNEMNTEMYWAWLEYLHKPLFYDCSCYYISTTWMFFMSFSSLSLAQP